MSWQDLKDTFRKAGNVVRADVSAGPDGRSKGYGTVLFETTDDADNAISKVICTRYNIAKHPAEMFNGADFDGRTINVHLDKRA